MQRLVFVLCAIGFNLLAADSGAQAPANRPFYPIGIYAVNATNDFEVVRKAGFNLIVSQADRATLDAARAVGLKLLARPDTAAGSNFNPELARRAVKRFDRHPALWAWYLADEPDLNEVPPERVREAHDCLKAARARKPTALVLYQGYEAGHYGNLADITMIDRYPIPWLPLANFGQHVTQARLAVAKNKPLLAVIQAFDWSAYPDMLPGYQNFRTPTQAELRCMTYEALARGANGLVYFAFDTGRWKIREHPETWEALKAVVREINDRLPLFTATPRWWAKNHRFSDPKRSFNAALESSVTSTLLRVASGNEAIPAGDYIVAVNNTVETHEYGFALPPGQGERRNRESGKRKPVSVLGEGRTIEPSQNRIQDTFGPLAIHVYGPLR